VSRILKLNDILKNLITQPHQQGSQVPAFLKLQAGFVGDKGDSSELYSKAKGKKYNSPRNLRGIVLGVGGGLIRYHTGLGNSKDGKLYHSIKHQIDATELQVLGIASNCKKPINELNAQLLSLGMIKTKAQEINIRNGISNRNLKFISSGGWGDNSYDFAYIEEILIDYSWAKLMGLLDVRPTLLDVGTMVFGGQVDMGKKFPRLMHIGISHKTDNLKDLVKSGSYKHLALDVIGNPTQVGIQTTKVGISYVIQTPEQVFNRFKPSKEVYELDAKIHQKLKGVGVVIQPKEVEVHVSNTQEIRNMLLENFLKQKPPGVSVGIEEFRRVINIQARPLVESKEEFVGESSKVDVIQILKVMLALKLDTLMVDRLKGYIVNNLKELELREWFMRTLKVHTKLVGLPIISLGNIEVDGVDIKIQQEMDSKVFEGVGLDVVGELGSRFKINNKSRFLRLRTLKGFKDNKHKIIVMSGIQLRFGEWFDVLWGLDTDFKGGDDFESFVYTALQLEESIDTIKFLDEGEMVEFREFHEHYKKLLFNQMEAEKVKFMKSITDLAGTLDGVSMEVALGVYEEILRDLPKAYRYIDRLGFATHIGQLQGIVRMKRDMILDSLSGDVGDEDVF
jgi:hypothetical protein